MERFYEKVLTVNIFLKSNDKNYVIFTKMEKENKNEYMEHMKKLNG